MLAGTALVSVEEALLYLDRPIGEDPDADDGRASKLEFLVNGVSTYFRNFLDRPLRNEVVEELLDGSGQSSIMLSQYPIVEIQELIVDDGYTRTTLTEDDLFVYKQVGKLTLKPTAPLGGFILYPQSVHVKYVAGYAADVEDVPWDLKQAAIEAIRHLYVKEYTNPSTIFGEESIPKYMSSKMPTIVKEYLSSYKRIHGGAA